MAERFGFIVGRESELAHRIRRTLGLIEQYGGIDGAHHKQWLLDQIIRQLTMEPGEVSPENPRGYRKWLAIYNQENPGHEDDPWDVGIAP